MTEAITYSGLEIKVEKVPQLLQGVNRVHVGTGNTVRVEKLGQFLRQLVKNRPLQVIDHSEVTKDEPELTAPRASQWKAERIGLQNGNELSVGSDVSTILLDLESFSMLEMFKLERIRQLTKSTVLDYAAMVNRLVTNPRGFGVLWVNALSVRRPSYLRDGSFRLPYQVSVGNAWVALYRGLDRVCMKQALQDMGSVRRKPALLPLLDKNGFAHHIEAIGLADLYNVHEKGEDEMRPMSDWFHTVEWSAEDDLRRLIRIAQYECIDGSPILGMQSKVGVFGAGGGPQGGYKVYDASEVYVR